MNGHSSAWTESLESFTEHAIHVEDVTGDRLYRSLPADTSSMFPDDGVREAVEAINAGTSPTGEQLPRWYLPGFGEHPAKTPRLYRPEKCGTEIPFVCSDNECGYSVAVGDTCEMSCCPRCGAAWAMHAAEGPMASLMHTRYRRDQAREEHIKLHHTVFSPGAGERFDVDEDAINQDVAEKALDVIGGVLKSFGIKDFWAAYHPWRKEDEHDVAPGEEEAPDQINVWKGDIFQGEGSESFHDLRDRALEYGPHFHVIAVADHFPGGDITKAINAATGWVIHRITADNTNVSLYSYKNLARALAYCLSHTALYTNGNGDRKAMTRSYGMVKSCKPSDGEKKWAKDLLRSPDVAGAVLGIRSASLECSAPDAETRAKIRNPLDDEGEESDDVEELEAAAGGGGYVPISSSSGAPPSGRPETDAGELPNDSGIWSSPGSPRSPDVDEDADDTAESDEEADRRDSDDYAPDDGDNDRCGGQMLPIWEVEDEINTEAWRESAAFAEKTLELVAEYAERVDRLDPPDDLEPPD